MKTNLRSVIILIVTLIIGIAIGLQVSEVLLKGKINKIKDFRQPHGFISFFEEVIKPDAKQKETIEPLILKYHKRTQEVTHDSFRQIDMIMDSLKTELKGVLTQEQYNRLDKRMTDMKKHRPDHDRPGHRPPPPPF